MLAIFQNLLGSFVGPKVIITLGTVLGLISGDTILGILLALKQGKFAFNKLAQFVQASLVPYVGGLLVLALFSSSNTELGALFFTIAATITAKFLADILTKISQLFGGFIQIQSPIKIEKSIVDVIPVSHLVSPSTDVSTNTPAADKMVPVEAAPTQPDPQPQPQPTQQPA